MLPVLQGCPPQRAGDPAASWGNPFAMGVSLQFMTKQEQPQSPCATEASPAPEQQSRGLQRTGWTQLWMCVNVSGLVPVQRGPEQCLCIAVLCLCRAGSLQGPCLQLQSQLRCPQPRRFLASPKRRGASEKGRPSCRRGGGRVLSLPRKRERRYPGLPQPTDTPYNSLFPVQTSSAGRAG